MFRIRIRQRSPQPKPWKWEICREDRLVTASHESYASQAQAYSAGDRALTELVAESERTAKSYEVQDGCMVPVKNKQT